MEQKIYGSLGSIMREVKAIEKSEKNIQQGFSFRGIDQVMNELHDLFAKHNVVSVPNVLEYDVSEKHTEKEYAGKKSVSITYYVRAKIEYKFISTEDGSSVSSVTFGEAMDNGDKAMNKAMSAALKYALLQLFLIPTKEMKDPDADSYTRIEQSKAMSLDEYINSLDPSDMSRISAFTDVRMATTKDALALAWKNHPEMHKDNIFKNYCTIRKGELK